jgi:putative protease
VSARPSGEKCGPGVCAVESIPTAKAPQRFIFLFFFVAYCPLCASKEQKTVLQVNQVAEGSPVPIEVFGFDSLCVMVEGRCLLSSYVTGRSPNTFGACSPADAVSWNETPGGLETRLNNILIDRYSQGESVGYPTLCKGHYNVGGNTYYAIEEPTSLNTLDLLPELQAVSVAAIKLEGRQRSPAYVAQVTQVWRAAIDACMQNPDS